MALGDRLNGGAGRAQGAPHGLSREFVKFWLGQSVSMLGNQFTLLALPIAAAVTLHASALEMGLLGAMRWAPGMLVGFPAGVWVDRSRRKPLLVAAQAVSAVALGTIPAAALIHVLSLGQLYVVAFVSGAAATVQTIAQTSLLPTIAGRDRLVEANTRIQSSFTVASLVGPGAAGAAIQLLTAPIAILVDAVAFAVGAVMNAWAHAEESVAASSRRPSMADVMEGQRWLWRQRLVRATTLTILINSGGSSITFAVFVLYFVTKVGITPAQLGLIFATSGLSALIGARLSGPLVRRGWLGPVMAVGAIFVVVGQSGALVAAYAPRGLAFPLLIVFNILLGSALMVYNINQQSIRQAVTPDRVLGRVQSGVFVLASLAALTGSLAGGVIGQSLGLRAAIAVGAAVCVTSALPSILSPLRRLRQVPALAT